MDANARLAAQRAVYIRTEARGKKFLALINELESITGQLRAQTIEPWKAANRMDRIAKEVDELREQQGQDQKQIEEWEAKGWLGQTTTGE